MTSAPRAMLVAGCFCQMVESPEGMAAGVDGPLVRKVQGIHSLQEFFRQFEVIHLKGRDRGVHVNDAEMKMEPSSVAKSIALWM